ncbi:Kae1/YgjD family [Penicillium alfredii]|uniref:N(6)-L-threonylcarbamoyladenine synthase n=1 Tax=Penicillium alfredii TaxID=1506179 RepID=A0A9W9FRI1_9EURO|nr:Kae1/YgjD family [Penicillium alfredii]KAJ5105086.1 Kae1/YgjD family [Penicillium alfredii]
MYAARPKLQVCTAVAQNATRPALSLKSPSAIPRTPISPVSAASPTSRRFSSLQVPSYGYINSCSSKSILKKQPSNAKAATGKHIEFKGTPTVHCVTPIENPDEYYGTHTKMSREERRWKVRDDDTSVAIVDKNERNKAKIHFLENVTADSRAHRGIHPILALESHQESLANLVNKALRSLPVSDHNNGIRLADGSKRRRPDFISATRGPGMRSNLSVGLDTGKALSVAWQIPMVGVHHMQAHLLTPWLVSCLANDASSELDTLSPRFPFLSILVSGGHSILVHSQSLTDHKIMASSDDIAMGETLDKSAREILPPSLLQDAKNTMYGKILEQFVFPNGPADFADYHPPMNRGEEVVKRQSPWGWSITTPFANTRALQLSFSSISSMVTKIVKDRNDNLSHEERVDLGREAMRVCFEHLASRTIIALEALRLRHRGDDEVKTLVVSGGVAANRFLMTVLRSFLDVRGFKHIKVVAPPPYLCTDNAAMIGWAGIEMFEAGWQSDLSCRALRKWTLDAQAEDGGVLGPSGWIRNGPAL